MAEIVCKQTIKPSSPTPHHLKDYKLSFLDQLSPHHYVPVLLFYSPSHHNAAANANYFSSFSEKLKTSLSDVLSIYYPFCGRIRGSTLVECTDQGVLFIDARVPSSLSETLQDPQPQVHDVLRQFLPFDPYRTPLSDHEYEPVNMAVQATEFTCGALALGVCISHKIADGTTVASFLNYWAATALLGRSGSSITAKKPYMEASLLFPSRDMNFQVPTTFHDKDIVTKRLVFDGKSLSMLRADIEGCNGGNNNNNNNPTRVEAVTALLWKSAMDAFAAARANSGEHGTFGGSIASHVVDIRSRMVPPLPDISLGNLNQTSVSPLVGVEMDKRVVDLKDLVVVVRKTIQKIDADHVSKLQGEGGFFKAIESVKQVMSSISKGVPWYCFSSWARFPFYEADFGWGRPMWVCTIGMPVRNGVTLMPTKNGDGIEAWVNLSEQDMVEFECNPELLKYASFA